MTVKERLKEFIDFKKISDRAFCASIGGVSFNYVNSIRKSIQPDKLKRITDVYPELNTRWLMTGDGEMLNTNASNQINGMGNIVAGSRNNVTTNDIAGMIELQKGYQEMLKEKDAQINRLISVIEKLSE